MQTFEGVHILGVFNGYFASNGFKLKKEPSHPHRPRGGWCLLSWRCGTCAVFRSLRRWCTSFPCRPHLALLWTRWCQLSSRLEWPGANLEKTERGNPVNDCVYNRKSVLILPGWAAVDPTLCCGMRECNTEKVKMQQLAKAQRAHEVE